MPMLNRSSVAARFLETMGTKSGRNAFIANADSFDDPRVKIKVAAAHNAMDEGLKVVDRLTRDESRTDASKHARAKKEAEKVSSALGDVHDQMIKSADELNAAAVALVDEYLKVDNINPFILSKKFEWVKEQWADPNGGAQRIREMVSRDPQLAALMCRTDAYLLGIPDAQRENYVEAGLKAHVPDADAKINSERKLRAAAERIAPIAADVHTNFYNEAIAMRLATRVED